MQLSSSKDASLLVEFSTGYSIRINSNNQVDLSILKDGQETEWRFASAGDTLWKLLWNTRVEAIYLFDSTIPPKMNLEDLLSERASYGSIYYSLFHRPKATELPDYVWKHLPFFVELARHQRTGYTHLKKKRFPR